VFFYSWCRVSALINLTIADYYELGRTRWLRFQEKRGKEHEVPVHSKAKEAVDLRLERSHLASNPQEVVNLSDQRSKDRTRIFPTDLSWMNA
jgi:integrase